MQLVHFKDHDVPRVEKDLGDTVVSGEPVQHVELKFSGNEDKFRSGIWQSTAGVFTADYTGIVEFCHILEGDAWIKTEDGQEFHVSAGDGFVLDAGLKTEWRVDSFIRKHFVICQQ